MTNQKYEVARIEDYGFKDYRKLSKLYKISFKAVVCIAVFILYIPILIIGIQSVNSNRDLSSWGGFTLKWYGQITSNRSLFQAIKNTFTVSIIAVLIATIVGTLIAIGINALSTKKRKKIILLNNIPILNPDIITGLSLMFIFSLLLPIFPYIFGITTLVLAHLFFTIPYVVLSVLPKLNEVDENLMDAALDLGVKPVRAIYKVIVPAIRAGIFSGMLLAFTMSIDDFMISFFTSGNGYDNLSIWIYSSVGKKSLTPSVYAFNTLMNIFVFGSLIAFNFITTRGNHKNKRKKRS